MLNRSLTIFVSKLIGYTIRLVLPYFLVRLISVAEFGAYRQFFLAELYIAILFQLGVNQALYYFVPRDERNAGAYFVNSLALNVVIFAAAFTLVGFVREPLSAWLNMPILDDAFSYLVLYTMIWMLIVSCDCYLTSRQRVKASAAFEVAGQFIASVMTVAAAFYWRDLERIFQAMCVARAAQLLAMLVYTHWRLRGFRAERYLQDVWAQVRYGVVLGLAGTALTFQMKLHLLFVSRYYGTETFAIYSVGCTEIPVVQILSQSVAVVALGKFALMEKERNWAGIRDLWTRILTSMYAVALPTIGLLLLVSEPLVRFMFTETYIGAVPIFRVNTLISLSIIHNATLVLRAMNRNDISVRVNVATLVVTPFALYGGMVVAGLTGVIAAQLVLLVAARLALLAWLNRISGARLAYLVGPRAFWTFYRETWHKLVGTLAAKLRQRAAGSGGAGA